MISLFNEKSEYIRALFLTVISILFFSAQTSYAKEYYYKNFEVHIKVKEDSTFDVLEKQTFHLNGSFGFFYRDIALKGIDTVTDIEVLDKNENKISKNELDIKSIGSRKHVQWNFKRHNFHQEEKSWTVKYKVHGGISFLNNYDEIYWNAIPQDRDVVIKNVKVIMELPNGKKFKEDLIQLYAEDIVHPAKGDYYSNISSRGGYYFNKDKTQAIFWGRNITPNTNFTVAAGFPKGIVSQTAYWKDFFVIYYGYILSLIVIAGSAIYGFCYWYKTEKSKEGKKPIVPHYSPPENLRPAMAEIITKEKLTGKGLAATVIDLAVRGYVKIEEQKKSKLEKYLSLFFIVSFLIFMIYICINIAFVILNIRVSSAAFYIFFPFVTITLIFPVLLKIGYRYDIHQKDYLVKKVKPYRLDPHLEEYEKEYLDAIFGLKNYFSTKETRKSPSQGRKLYKKIKKVKDKIYEETELDTRAFEIGPTMEKRKKSIWMSLIIAILIMLWIFAIFNFEMKQPLILLAITATSFIALWAFIKYEARLSKEGLVLKENWLGFKMYLETAEKYRMQNLKPEYFEQYLPYAIIFGVEKKWARAFENMHMLPPSWYTTSSVGISKTTSSSSPSKSFSPLAFSSSFASSFPNALSVSGASGTSGASGGGGGAGGGGGGGGGGAG